MNQEPATLQLQVQDWLLRRVPVLGVRRVLPVAAALGSDVGVVRKENQDRVILARGCDYRGNPYVVVALADGVGGMANGAQCAALAVGAVVDVVHRKASSDTPPSEWVNDAVKDAHQTVRPAFAGSAGATLVVLLVTQNEGIYWASVGDSRLYLSKSDALIQISTDDTIAGQLGRHADHDVEQGRLLQYLGMQGPLEFEVSKLSPAPGQLAILTTDGVHFLASGSDVMSLVIRHSPDIGATTRRLIDLARWAGGQDNATVAIMSLDVTHYEPLPAFACIDVWDPFGEIRFPVPAHENQKTLANGVVRKAQSTEKIDAPTVELPAAVQPVDSDEKIVPKKKGEKIKDRKRKPRAPRGAPVPQVQLEFSNKKS